MIKAILARVERPRSAMRAMTGSATMYRPALSSGRSDAAVVFIAPYVPRLTALRSGLDFGQLRLGHRPLTVRRADEDDHVLSGEDGDLDLCRGCAGDAYRVLLHLSLRS